MRFDEPENAGEKVWGCSTHAIEQFIERNKFLNPGDYRAAITTLLKMMKKATFVCYESREKMAEIWTYGNWIFVTKESTIVTVYKRKGSKFENRIK